MMKYGCSNADVDPIIEEKKSNNLTMPIIALITQEGETYIAQPQEGETYIAQPYQEIGTDAVSVKVDNCASRSMSFNINDFISSTMVPMTDKAVRGFGNTITPITHKGTIVWSVYDDNGMLHHIKLKESYYVPNGSTRLLSPQHWAQQAKDTHPIVHGTWCGTYFDKIVCHWDQCQYTLTIPLDSGSSNVGTVMTASGYQQAFAAVAPYWDQVQHLSFPSKILIPEIIQDVYPEHTDDHGIPIEIGREPATIGAVLEGVNDLLVQENAEEVVTPSEGVVHELQLPTTKEVSQVNGSTKEFEQEIKNRMELRWWHEKLGHISMHSIQHMAKLGELPSNIAKCKIPMCKSCLLGMMTKRPWRTKAAPTSRSMIIEAPGDCVSVDQLESNIPGFIGQLKGIPTKSRYRVASIYVDNYSDFTYIHMQQTTNASETVEGKRQFEVLARSHGVVVKHYHADNGRFIENLWVQEIRNLNQGMSYSGVGAHHQNGRAEKKIRDVQDLARSSLIHAMSKWPEAIDIRLWPYAIKKAAHNMNFSIRSDQELCPKEKFAKVRVAPNLRHEHTFGCPMYVLDSRIQGGMKAGKWSDRSRIAIYLGPSTQYARSVGLALSLTTGLVSPQFHARYDDDYVTLDGLKQDQRPNSLWQSKCHFTPSRQISIDVNPQILPSGVDLIEPTPADLFPINEPEIPETDTIDEPRVVDQIFEQPENPVLPTPDLFVPTRDVVTRSGRVSRPNSNIVNFPMVTYEATEDISVYVPIQQWMDPCAFAASSDPDILYLHEAMMGPDKPEFLIAMIKEVEGQTKNENWIIVLRSDLPSGTRILPCVWAMRRKRRIMDGLIYKWKARLNVDGGKQIYGIDYWETYAPVATWFTIRLILIMALKEKWVIKTLDFVQAYPQAPVETELYIDIPKGFLVNGTRNEYALKILRNVYGQKQAGRVWNQFLVSGLLAVGFKQSPHDMCLFWRHQCIIVIYTDDTIIIGPNSQEVDDTIKVIASKFDITSNDDLEDFLGVNISYDLVGGFTLSQPQLIKSILHDLGLLTADAKSKETPSVRGENLHDFPNSQDHHESWHYRSVIGKLNYLEKCSRPDISFAVHQCARYSQSPKTEHSQAVKRIGRYLLGTADKGIIYAPDDSSLVCFCDASFSGEWDKDIAEFQPATARSRTGFVITYGNCPVIWSSKLQTEIALSTTESEYVALSQSLREVIPTLELLKDLGENGFKFNAKIPEVHCKVFEDNEGAIEMARLPKMRPRTKHMNIKYHHFREAVSNGLITIHHVASQYQLADIFTKSLLVVTFLRLRKSLIGW